MGDRKHQEAVEKRAVHTKLAAYYVNNAASLLKEAANQHKNPVQVGTNLATAAFFSATAMSLGDPSGSGLVAAAAVATAKKLAPERGSDSGSALRSSSSSSSSCKTTVAASPYLAPYNVAPRSLRPQSPGKRGVRRSLAG